jgi:hypothetical protein
MIRISARSNQFDLSIIPLSLKNKLYFYTKMGIYSFTLQYPLLVIFITFSHLNYERSSTKDKLSRKWTLNKYILTRGIKNDGIKISIIFVEN